MHTISPLLLDLQVNHPEEYEELVKELECLKRSVSNCLAVNNELHAAIQLATLITSSKYRLSPYRLLVLMAACEKREQNGWVLLNAMDCLVDSHPTSTPEQEDLLSNAGSILSRWWILNGHPVSFGHKLDVALNKKAAQLRQRYNLRPI